MVSELRQLNDHRLEHDLTFQAIADAMSALGYPITAPTVQRMLRHPERAPLERTMYKVRKYLKHLRAKRKSRTPPRRPTAPITSEGAHDARS